MEGSSVVRRTETEDVGNGNTDSSSQNNGAVVRSHDVLAVTNGLVFEGMYTPCHSSDRNEIIIIN